MSRPLSILFVGDLRPYTRSEQRLRALRDLGHEVHEVSSAPDDDVPGTRRPSLAERVRRRAGVPADPARANAAVAEALRARRLDLVWVEKALCLRAETLRRARLLQPSARLAFFSEDDMALRHNQSRHFRRALPLYDAVFTTKSRNLERGDLAAQGARAVHYVEKSFDPAFHRPVAVDEAVVRELGARVGFVGTFERERAEALLFLAENGVAVRVWGNGWEAWRGHHPVLRVEGRPVWGEDYVRALCATDVNLGFLRRRNHDRHTDRTLEIPACGAFLLAERTPEQAGLLAEGVEADYFEEHGELLQKVRHWLEHPEERRRVAAAGRARLLEDGRTHQAALARMLARVVDECPGDVEAPAAALPRARRAERRGAGVLGG